MRKTKQTQNMASTTNRRQSQKGTTSCNKQWLSSKKVRPKTVVIVAERTQDGYTVKSATVRVAVNQHVKTAIPITDLNNFVKDINQKGIKI